MLNLERIVHWLVFSAALCVPVLSNAQELKVVSKITNDSVCIKWLPSNYFALRAMNEGATVKRIEATSELNIKTLDYSNAKTWEIAPLKERASQLNRADTTEDKMATLLEPVLEWAPKEEQNFAFGAVLIENVTNSQFQYVLGNLIVERDLDKSKKYAYRIEVEGVKPVYVFIDPSAKTQYPTLELELELDQKKTVVCSWNYDDVQKDAFAFDVHHSIADSTHLEMLFDKPYLPFKSEFETHKNASIRHDEPLQGKFHYYQIVGRDPFGEKSLVSEWQKIYVPKRINAYPIIDSVTALKNTRTIHVHTITDVNKTNIETIALYQSKFRDSDFTLIQETSTFDSIVKMNTTVENETGDAFYYKAALVCADDTVYSLPFYFFTLDQSPPDAPTDLAITIDSLGIVRLNWSAPKDEDIQGYRVFRANQKAEEFVEKTTALSTSNQFTDTVSLNNLTSEIYYYIKTVDLNYNQSKSSDTILGIKPDTIAPIPSFISKISLQENALHIDWIASESEDLQASTLFRNGVEIGIVSNPYLDTSLVAGTFYEYYFQTTDKTGNKAISKTISQKYEPGFRSAMEFQAVANFEKHAIELNWKPPDQELYAIKIYKAVGDEKLRLWKTIKDFSKTSISDTDLSIGDTYRYSVIYTTKEGISSTSNTLTINY